MRYTVNTDFFKQWVHDRVYAGPGSGWHLPQDADEDYCKQIVAEARVVNERGVAVWVQKFKDNHYLDCEMMQIACAYSKRLQHCARPPKTEESDDDDGGSNEPEPEQKPARPKQRQRGGRVPKRGKWSSTRW